MLSVRNEYDRLGVDGFYKVNALSYHNPHEPIVRDLVDIAVQGDWIGTKVLDMCCGSGEVSRCLDQGPYDITGTDPYLFDLYALNTGNKVLPYSFKDIANGKLKEDFDTVICSFALHLCPKSLLHSVLWQLQTISDTLIVISPNKNPDCHGVSGWNLADEITLDRVRMKIYKVERLCILH